MADLALIDVKESAKAAAAWADYVDLGPTRSLRKLAAQYVKQGRYKTETTAFNALAEWSGEHQWQARLAEMALRRADLANDFRADTWVAITGEYHRRVVEEPAMRRVMKLESLNSIFDRVKPDTPNDRSGSGGSITLTFAFIEASRPD